jgi:hypothetical protein
LGKAKPCVENANITKVGSSEEDKLEGEGNLAARSTETLGEGTKKTKTSGLLDRIQDFENLR